MELTPIAKLHFNVQRITAQASAGQQLPTVQNCQWEFTGHSHTMSTFAPSGLKGGDWVHSAIG